MATACGLGQPRDGLEFKKVAIIGTLSVIISSSEATAMIRVF